MKTKKPVDIVYNICEQMIRNSPKRSYKRLNPALHSTLANSIKADLPFLPTTFSSVYNELRGGYWFGDGEGSHMGEGFYNIACAMNHASAQQSFEQFANRPACLWEEDAKLPVRLHVGSRFTWKGYFLTVTSMRSDSLVACTYKDYESPVRGIKAGAVIGDYDDKYLITDSHGGTLCVVKAKKTNGSRIVAKRFTIPYSEIKELRRSSKARLHDMLVKIASCDPIKDSKTLTAEINANHFRHFELEEIQNGFGKRRSWVANQSKVEAWRQGKDGAWFGSKIVLLRLNGDLVECSNGNSVSKNAAEGILPVLLKHRNKTNRLDIQIDSYRIKSIGASGVKIGCTLVPWEEVEWLATELGISA